MNKKPVILRTSIATLAVLISEVVLAALLLVGWLVLVPLIPGMKLNRPDFAWFFIAGPAVSALFLLMFWLRRKSLGSFASPYMLDILAPSRSTAKPVLRFLLFRWALFFLTVAVINPKVGTKMAEARHEGIDIMVAIDVSRSMLAEDIKPNRLERAKMGIRQMLDKLHGDRLGIVVFAGDAYVQLPITTDYSAARMFLNTINTDVVPVQGTSIGAAIARSMESFDFDNPTQKAIIIISDGEDHEAEAIAAAKRAGEQGVVIHTIGMGTAQGGPIPIFQGKQRVGYHKDREGNTVITKLDERTLQDIATAANGKFVRASTASMGIPMIMDEINEMTKTEFGTTAYAEYEDRFQVFIVLALVLLLIEQLVSERRSRWLEKIQLFNS